jgi:outer membrane cobalamin receptor
MFYLPISSILDLKNLSFFSMRKFKSALSISLCLAMGMVAAEEPLITLPSLDITSNNDDVSEDLPRYSDYSAEDIENTGAISTTDFLNKQGALQVRSNSSSQNQTSISLRGFGANAANNSLILVNGIPLASFSHVPPSLNSIPLNSIDSINLYLGSYGSLYGDQAVGGVIDIETTIPDKQSRELTIGLGNQQQRQASFFWFKTLDEHNAFQFSGEHFKSGHFQPSLFQVSPVSYEIPFCGLSDRIFSGSQIFSLAFAKRKFKSRLKYKSTLGVKW